MTFSRARKAELMDWRLTARIECISPRPAVFRCSMPKEHTLARSKFRASRPTARLEVRVNERCTSPRVRASTKSRCCRRGRVVWGSKDLKSRNPKSQIGLQYNLRFRDFRIRDAGIVQFQDSPKHLEYR